MSYYLALVHLHLVPQQWHMLAWLLLVIQCTLCVGGCGSVHQHCMDAAVPDATASVVECKYAIVPTVAMHKQSMCANARLVYLLLMIVTTRSLIFVLPFVTPPNVYVPPCACFCVVQRSTIPNTTVPMSHCCAWQKASSTLLYHSVLQTNLGWAGHCVCQFECHTKLWAV